MALWRSRSKEVDSEIYFRRFKFQWVIRSRQPKKIRRDQDVKIKFTPVLRMLKFPAQKFHGSR